jgi:hypothetical protein
VTAEHPTGARANRWLDHSFAPYAVITSTLTFAGPCPEFVGEARSS